MNASKTCDICKKWEYECICDAVAENELLKATLAETKEWLIEMKTREYPVTKADLNYLLKRIKEQL